jgi:predicted MPP superfamily phosphohydrolase
VGQLIKKKLPSNVPVPGESWDLYFLNDMHVGNAATSIKDIQKVVRLVKGVKNSYVACLGDLAETIAINDKRYSFEEHGSNEARWNSQRRAIRGLLEPIRDKILWMLDGNHEFRVNNIYQPTKDLADDLGAIYANGTAVKALFPNWRLMTVHGSGMVVSRAGDAMQRKVNELIGLKRNLRRLPAADCAVIACGHYHNLWVHEPVKRQLLVTDPSSGKLVSIYTEPGKIYIDKKKDIYRIPEEDRYYLCSGSYLRGYVEDMPTYIERANLEATELGYGHITIRKGVPTKVEAVPI